MNVKFDGYNTADVAEILKVNKAAVGQWVHNGWIIAQDVSEPGSTVPRFLYTDEEVDRVKRLRKKYGRFWGRQSKLELDAEREAVNALNPVSNTEEVEDKVLDKPSGKNPLIMKIEKVKDLKDELENIEARRNQILAEIEQLKNEIIDAI